MFALKLSRREQILVWILINGLVLLGAVKYNLIGKSNQVIHLKEETEALSRQQQEAQDLLMNGPSLIEQYEENEVSVQTLQENFFDKMEVELLQQWLAKEQSSYQVVTQVLNLEEAAPYAILFEEDELQGEAVEEKLTQTVVYENKITLQLVGEKNNILNFVDHLVHSGKNIVVNGLGFNEIGGTLSISCYSHTEDVINLEDLNET